MKKLDVITKKTIITTVTCLDSKPSERTTIVYSLNGVASPSRTDQEVVREVYKKAYKTQGEFYQDVYGVSPEVAEQADWHPTDSDFCSVCDGWTKFILNKGIANVHTHITEVELSNKLF